MGSTTKFYFTVAVKGEPRSLCSVTERSSGDLIISMFPGDVLRDNGKVLNETRDVSTEHGKHIEQQKYSIHTSKHSPTHNIIKHTLEYGGRDVLETYHRTSAIKSKGRFAFVFGKRCSNLSTPVYAFNPTKNTSSISLGNFLPGICTLFFAIFVAGHEQKFTLQSHDINIFEKKTREFRIVIMWSFISLPALPSGYILHNLTLSPKDLQHDEALIEAFSKTQEGFDQISCIEHFRYLRCDAQSELISVLLQTFPDCQDNETFLKCARSMRTSDPNSQEWQNFILDLIRYGFAPVSV